MKPPSASPRRPGAFGGVSRSRWSAGSVRSEAVIQLRSQKASHQAQCFCQSLRRIFSRVQPADRRQPGFRLRSLHGQRMNADIKLPALARQPASQKLELRTFQQTAERVEFVRIGMRRRQLRNVVVLQIMRRTGCGRRWRDTRPRGCRDSWSRPGCHPAASKIPVPPSPPLRWPR